MLSSPLHSTHDRTTSSVARHHCRWVAHMAVQHMAWNIIITFGQNTLSNDVEQGMPSSPLGRTHHLRLGCGMPSSPLCSTHGHTTSSHAFHHLPWEGHTIRLHRACHDISPLENTQSLTTLGVACHHCLLDNTH